MKRATWAVVAAYAAIALAVITFRPAQTGGPFLRDFEAYWSAGSTWNDGGNPYGAGIWRAERAIPGVDASHDELLPFVGPPASLWLWSALARLPYVDAARVWFVALAVAGLAFALLALRAAGAALDARTIVAGAAFAFAFGPLTSDLALGQIALFAVAGATIVAIVRLGGARAALGSTAATVATVVALLQPNVAAGLAARIDRGRAVACMLGGAAIAYLSGALAMGWQWPAPYAHLLFQHRQVERIGTIQMTPGAIAYGAGIAPQMAEVVALLAAAAAIAAAVALWRRVHDPFARFAAISALAPFVASFMHEHDLIVAFPAAAWCAVRTRGSTRALALLATLLAAVDWLGLAQRPTGIAQSALLAGAVACAFVALGETPWPRLSSALLAGAGVFAVAAWSAATHPAPVWPDALAHFHAAAGASATQIWFAEQSRTGLLAPNPAWAFLRTLSLAGCALLSLCIVTQTTADTRRPRDGHDRESIVIAK